MNTQAELAQIDVEIAELQAKLTKAQERRELLALVKPACDSALEEIDKALDILLCVELSTKVEMAEITKFKTAVDAKFKFKEEQRAIQAEVKPSRVIKTESKRKPSGYRAKVLADKCFPTRPAQKMQLQVIIQELEAIGIEVGTIISGSSNIKGWNLCWNGDKAGLFWTVGQGWEIEGLTPEGRLAERWEGFDLDDYLTANDIDLEEYVA